MADYAGVLADLRARRDGLAGEMRELDTAIAALERLSAGGVAAGTQVTPVTPWPVVNRQTFAGMTLPQAVEKLMRMVNRPQTTREVVDALRLGGVPADAKSFSNQVYNALHRMSTDNGPFQRQDNAWALRQGAYSNRDGGLLLRETH